jgi:uncharacterized protein (DUF1684 family)
VYCNSTPLTTSFRLFGINAVFVTCVRIRPSEAVRRVYHALSVYPLSASWKVWARVIHTRALAALDQTQMQPKHRQMSGNAALSSREPPD